MANYANLEAFIQAKVYENANNEITGQGLQDTLLEMVKELGKSGFICQGVATTSTTPPVSSDSNIFYFAEGAGTYTNFGGLVVGVGELALFFWNGSTWDKESCNIVEIIDNLTTNDSTKALSAKQGKVLNDALQALRQTLDSMDILDNVAGSAVGLLNPIAENAEFAFQKSGSKGDGAALINSIKGKSLVWNQLVNSGDSSITPISGHKYLTIIGGVKAIITSDGTPIAVSGGTDCVFDLTLMGLDYITSVAEFEALYPLDYYDYNAGELKSNDAQSIVTKGRNQWDEEWENGYWDGGVFRPNPTKVASKNHIKILPNTTYYAKCPAPVINLEFYDAEGGLNSALGISSNAPFTTPANAVEMSFYLDNVSTYNHDICLNISDASFNGQYEPYWKDTCELNIKTLTGKKDGIGASVTIFPDGAGGVGSVYDELRKTVAYKRFVIEDMGNLEWTYDSGTQIFYSAIDNYAKTLNIVSARYGKALNMPFQTGDDKELRVWENIYNSIYIKDSAYSDAATFKTAMNGVKLIYEMATPETYVLDTPLKMTYKVAKGGTEERISPNADGISAPMVEEVHYPMQTKGDADYIIGVTDGNPATINLILPIDAIGAVFLTCGGATFSALVSAGQATLSISGIASGTYTFVAMYSGDEKYAPFSVSDTVTIS